MIAGGDDVAFNATMAPTLMASAGEGMRYFVSHLAEDLSTPRRAGRIVRALSDPGWASRSSSGHCEVGARRARRLGLDDAVCDARAHAFERWFAAPVPLVDQRQGVAEPPVDELGLTQLTAPSWPRDVDEDT